MDNQWLRQIVVQVILLGAAALAGIWLLYALRKIFLLLALTIFFCYFISPIIEFIERPLRIGRSVRRAPHTLAIGIVYLLLFGVVTLALELLLPLLSEQVGALAAQAPSYAERLNQYAQHLSSLPGRYHLPAGWQQTVRDGLNATFVGAMTWLQSGVVRVVQLTLYLPWLVLIPILGFFLLKDGKAFTHQILISLPDGDTRRRAANFLNDVSRTLAAYIRAQLLACLIVGTVVAIGLRLLGTPYSLVLGVAAAVLEFIPLVGPLSLAVIAALVASFESWRLALLVLAFLGLLRVIEDYVIYPRLIGREVEMHPLVVILAVLCGAELGGIAGVFLAVPVAALLVVSLKHWRGMRSSAG
ncbi:MAG TPA: AI-2E family transporter [Blastocatellia bacterium]|nr:AI-2E family transporter [Blastocatellia bacterium]